MNLVRWLTCISQASYDNSCRSKLTDIAQSRTRQAVNLQEQLRNPQAPQMSMMQPQMQLQGMPISHNPPPFPWHPYGNPQIHQPMQASATPIQQPFMHQHPQLVMANQPIGMQHMPHGLHLQIHPNPGGPHLSAEDHVTIQRMAHSLAANTPSDQLDIIRNNLENMQPEQRQLLAQQNLDPLTFFFRSQAARKFLDQKARIGQRTTHDLNVPGNVVMPQQPRPPSQNSLPIQSLQGHPSQVPPSQMIDPTFGGNVDQILVQQQDALRSQEAGQVVVPASHQRGNIRGTPQQPPNTSLGGSQVVPKMTHVVQVAPQYWANPQMMQGNMHQGLVQATPHTSAIGNMPVPAQLQPQVGGLGQASRVPQQSPNIPNFSKGLKETPSMQNRWHQRLVQSNQLQEQTPMAMQQAVPQSGASVEMDIHHQRQRQLNQQFASMPPDQRREFLKKNQAGQQSSHQDVSSNTAIITDAAHDPTPPQQSLMAVPGSQQASLHKPQNASRYNTHIAQVANPLTEEQARQMDQLEFPRNILNSSGTLAQLPPSITSWGQLKAWVSQKNNELPQGVLRKINLLQGLHFQSLARQNNQTQPSSQNPALGVQSGVRTPVPTAPMLPARGNGQPFQAGNSASIAQEPKAAGSPAVPHPTVQEIQAWRARIPENLQGLTDEQIVQLILKNRQEFIKSQGQQNVSTAQGPNVRQRTYQPGIQPQQLPTPGNRLQHQQQSSRPVGPTSKEQQVKQPSSNRNLPSTQSQGQHKGIKRNSNDDMIEASNQSNVTHEPQPQQMQSHAADPSKPNLQQALSEQILSAHPPKQPVKAEQTVYTKQRAPDPRPQLPAQAAPGKAQLETEHIKMRLNQLAAEIASSMPPRQPTSINPQTKAKMIQKLREAKQSVCRIDNALPMFYRFFRDDNAAKELIRIVCKNHHFSWLIANNETQRLLLVSQYRAADFTPIEQLTVTPEELDSCLEKLQKCFQAIQAMAKMVQHKGYVSTVQTTNQPQPQPQPQGVLPAGSKTQLTPETASTLSTANLKEHQKAMQVQREASVHKINAAHNGNRAPAAPTSPQPPFHFGSPDGVPSKYAERTDELTQERLRIPPKKKRRSDQAPVSIPAQPPSFNASKSPQLAKTAPSLTQHALSESHSYKCQVLGCANQLNGFPSQADLEKHISDIHDPKEPTIEDPLGWTLEQMRSGLGLEENGKPKPVPTESKAEKHISEAAKMKKTPSAQGQAAVKEESATPMTRIPTQTGPSPSSNLLKTPQPSTTMKTPGSEAQLIAKDVKVVESKIPQFSTSKPANTTPDLWATSLVSHAAISGAFSGLTSLNSTGAWSTMQHAMTPSSTLSSGISEKTSPRVSDISENDAVKINLSSDPLDYFDWLTFDSINSEEFPNGSDYEVIDRMDWDSGGSDRSRKEVETDIPREGAVEDAGPSQEWVRTFAPESLHRKHP